MEVALGKKEADSVIKNGKLVNVITEEIYGADVAIFGNRIAAVGDVEHCIGDRTTIIDANGKYLVPGLIDGHVHPDNTQLSPNKFASAVLPRGTTSVIGGYCEIATVSGLKAIRVMLDEIKNTHLKIFLTIPSHIPYIPWADTVGAEISVKEIEEAMKWEETIGIQETMIQSVLSLDADVLNAIDLILRNRFAAHGHAPFAKGKELSAYLITGVRSDHESFSADEVLEKARQGVHVTIREGSVAHNLHDCIKAVTVKGINTRYISVITDDLDAEDIVELGHLDHVIRKIIKEGIEPINAIQMVTINTAEAFKIEDRVGAIAPGRFADILIVSKLDNFKVDKVVANSELVAENGRMLKTYKSVEYPEWLLKTFHLRTPVNPSDLCIKVEPEVKKVRVISMQVPKEIPLRFRREAVLEVKNGIVKPNVDEDVLLISVVERYGKNGNKATAFISGFGLKKGAIASSVAHDSHNIVALGTNPEDMATAVNYIAEKNGGMIAVVDRRVVHFIPLPIGGLMTDKNAEELTSELKKMNSIVHGLGCPIDRPFMFLMFIPLAGIPEYAITDRGLVDTVNQRFISPIIERL